MAINYSTNGTGQSGNNTSIASATRLAIKVQIHVDFCRAFTNTTAGIIQIATTTNTNVKVCLFSTTDNAGNISFTLNIPGQGGLSTTSSAVSAFPANGNDIIIYFDVDGVGNAQHLVVFNAATLAVLQTATGSSNLGALITGTSGAILLNDTNPSSLSVAGYICGLGIYGALLTGVAQSSAPASGDANLLQMDKFTDATSGTTPNPSVATSGQNITNSGTWAYANDTAAGTWFGATVITGTVALAGGGTIATASVETFQSTGVLEGMGSVGVTATETMSAAAALAGSGSIGGSAFFGWSATVSLASMGSLGAAAIDGLPATAGLAGGGSLGASGVVGIGIQINLFGSGTLSAAALETIVASIVNAGMGSMAAAGVVIVPLFVTVQLFGGGSVLSAAGNVPPVTASTPLLVQAIRNQLLNFVRWDGANLQQLLSNPDLRLYEIQAPDGVQFPYGVIRLRNRTNRLRPKWRQNFDVEIDFYSRPRSQMPLVQVLGDITEEALLSWIEPTAGVKIQDIRRETINFDRAPADREVVRENIVASGYCAVLYLMSGDVIP